MRAGEGRDARSRSHFAGKPRRRHAARFLSAIVQDMDAVLRAVSQDNPDRRHRLAKSMQRSSDSHPA